MTVTITFHGVAAGQFVRSLAMSYAMLSIKSTLPSDCVNAPWGPKARGKPWNQAYREWMRGIDAERADLRKSLQSVLPELPDVPRVEWKSYTSPDGKTYSAIYSGPRAVEAAKAYAGSCAAYLGLSPGKNR